MSDLATNILQVLARHLEGDVLAEGRIRYELRNASRGEVCAYASFAHEVCARAKEAYVFQEVVNAGSRQRRSVLPDGEILTRLQAGHGKPLGVSGLSPCVEEKRSEKETGL